MKPNLRIEYPPFIDRLAETRSRATREVPNDINPFAVFPAGWLPAIPALGQPLGMTSKVVRQPLGSSRSAALVAATPVPSERKRFS